MSRLVTDNDAFVLASCMGNRLAIENTIIAPLEIQILIAHLDRVAGLNPVEKTQVFLAHKTCSLVDTARRQGAFVRYCLSAYQHGRDEECDLANKGFLNSQPERT